MWEPGGPFSKSHTDSRPMQVVGQSAIGREETPALFQLNGNMFAGCQAKPKTFYFNPSSSEYSSSSGPCLRWPA